MDYLKAIPRTYVLLIAVFVTCFLGLTDHLTGDELSFSIFYLIPISFVTLATERRSGLFVSVLAAIVWLTADIAGEELHPNVIYPIWNATVRLGYFVLHTMLLSSLLDAMQAVKEQSMYDALTGAANIRYFEDYARRILEQCRREKKPVTIAYVDLDNFKEVNDTQGHAVGDDLLQTVSLIMRDCIRSTDMLCRAGGDEFIILLPDADYDESDSILNRIRDRTDQELRTYEVRVTFSMGAVTYASAMVNVSSMIKSADEAMYTVKKSGKNGLRHDTRPREKNRKA